MTGEDQLVAWLRERTESLGWRHIGDDAAILPAAPYLTTVDTQIAGVHFAPETDPRIVARRLLAVNLSDLAAMGAEPAFAFLALSTPRDFPHRPFFEALIEACQDHGVELAGGDLSCQTTFTAALTLLGTPTGRILRRDAGEIGQGLWLGGPVGLSTLGCRLMLKGARLADGKAQFPADLSSRIGKRSPTRKVAESALRHHLEPTPQLELGYWLAQQDHGAAIDLSDGLCRDLHRLCRASECGARIEAAALAAGSFEAEKPGTENRVIGNGLEELADLLGARWIDGALAGGEDYVLLFSLPPGQMPPEKFRCRKIGELTEDRSIVLCHPNGEETELPPAGWDHLHDAT